MRVGSIVGLTTTETNLFVIPTDGAACHKAIVKCRAGSANPIIVRCPQLGHATANEGFRLAAGESVILEVGEPLAGGINQVIARSTAATADVDFAVVGQ
jgi:hypothetical protein